MHDLPVHTEVEHRHHSASSTDESVHKDDVIHVFIHARFLQYLGVFLGLAIIFGSATVYFKTRIEGIPQDYEQCVKRTGSRLEKSIPSICITLEGNYFIQPITDEQGNPLIALPTVSLAPTEAIVSPTPHSIDRGCKRAGCNGQLCIDANSQDKVSSCDFKPEYVCYQKAQCERQLDGDCGFTPSDELSQCLGVSTVNNEYRKVQ